MIIQYILRTGDCIRSFYGNVCKLCTHMDILLVALGESVRITLFGRNEVYNSPTIDILLQRVSKKDHHLIIKELLNDFRYFAAGIWSGSSDWVEFLFCRYEDAESTNCEGIGGFV